MMEALADTHVASDEGSEEDSKPPVVASVGWERAAVLRWTGTGAATPSDKADVATGGAAPRADQTVVRIPVARPLLGPQLERFELLQQYEGTVLVVGDGEFEARLRDLTAGHPSETAMFDMGDVSDDDRDLVRPGAVFYWNLGYRILRTGQKGRTAEVRFRRLPMWSRGDLARVAAVAEGWATLFGDDDGPR